MYSIKVACFIFCVEFLFITEANVNPRVELLLNGTIAEDRRDIQMKKPPRKRATLSLSYGNPLSHSFQTNHFKSFGQMKKEFSSPTLIEKYIAMPVHVKVPVDRPIPVQVPKLYPVTVEKAVPVPIKVNVPQPYPVYKKIAVPVKIPIDRPVPVQVLKPYPVYVEKQVPYPVDKPVPIPVKVPVDRPFPVYISVEKSTEKPVMMQMKWQPEKTLSLPTGKSLSWLEKPETGTSSLSMMKMNVEDVENEKLVSSLFEIPEQSESEISWPENMDFEIQK